MIKFYLKILIKIKLYSEFYIIKKQELQINIT